MTTYTTSATNKVLLRVTDPKQEVHNLGPTIEEIDAWEKRVWRGLQVKAS